MTVDDAKAYLRLETAQDDALLTGLVASARGLCEAFLGQRLIRSELTETVPADGVWHRLAAAPVATITQVGAPALPLGVYAIDIDPVGDGWVRVTGGGDVPVTYRAGIAEDEASVPAAIAQGVVRLAAHLYVDRADASAPPAAVAALWRPFRRLRLSATVRA
ncbi:head-tail connector protein [uncultured Sphingomonas sp.]|uniref:head-tail connector protein n=1 Tax=uncultured Sphingomonas sp. TaxID=158754 RepID=UPI0025D1144A|nr:head-tail connector protein [uncultured Sphingomonas sp.]